MKVRNLMIALIAVLGVQCAMATSTVKLFTEKGQFKNQADKVSYAMGMDIGENFKNQNIQITPAAFVSGLIAGTNGKGALFSTTEVRQILIKF